MKFSEILWTMTLIKLATRPEPSGNGDNDNFGAGCGLAIFIAFLLIFGIFAIFS
jgi:hypothetical protein